jgi:hypothetical protein
MDSELAEITALGLEIADCYKCQDWDRLGLSSRCPHHDAEWMKLQHALKPRSLT